MNLKNIVIFFVVCQVVAAIVVASGVSVPQSPRWLFLTAGVVVPLFLVVWGAMRGDFRRGVAVTLGITLVLLGTMVALGM
jgi:hypothetical protein